MFFIGGVKMGVSIYYSAKREYLLSDEELREVENIIERYNAQFKYAHKGETFSLYEYDEGEPQVILQGATKLISSLNPFALRYNLKHWMKCLAEIRHAVDGADWSVQLDELDAEWKNDRWALF